MATSTKKYRVLIGLSYPKSKKIWDRIVDGGERIPFDERGEIVDRRPGAIVTMPAHVVKCFMDMGAIELYVPSKKEADNDS